MFKVGDRVKYVYRQNNNIDDSLKLGEVYTISDVYGSTIRLEGNYHAFSKDRFVLVKEEEMDAKDADFRVKFMDGQTRLFNFDDTGQSELIILYDYRCFREKWVNSELFRVIKDKLDGNCSIYMKRQETDGYLRTVVSIERINKDSSFKIGDLVLCERRNKENLYIEIGKVYKVTELYVHGSMIRVSEFPTCMYEANQFSLLKEGIKISIKVKGEKE